MKKSVVFLILQLRDSRKIQILLQKTPLKIIIILRRILFFLNSRNTGRVKSFTQEYSTKLEPLVSVVIPNFNHGEFLEGAIQSVVAQSFTNIELIVIDDGSTDNSQEVLNKFKSHPKIEIFLNEHKGLTEALNFGFSVANGSILTWTSADNLIHPNGLETMVKAFVENSNSGMIFGDYTLIDKRGALLKNSNFRKYDQDSKNNSVIRTYRPKKLDFYLPDNFIGPFFAYRREVASEVGQYSDLRGFEDYDYWLRINKVCEITHLPSDGDLYYYRIHENTLTSQARENHTYRKLINHLKTQGYMH